MFNVVEKCPFCETESEPQVVIETNGIHYARALCAKCLRFIKWLPKPENEKDAIKNRYRTVSVRLKERKMREDGIDYCQVCMLKKENLPPGQTLEGHHVKEFHENMIENSEDPNNILICCTFCHSLIGLLRRLQ